MRRTVPAAIMVIASSLSACSRASAAFPPVVAARGVLTSVAGETEKTQPHPAMLRNPDVSATHIVFVYADDLWLVSRDGGMAVPLASPPGQEQFPRFSLDGATIAFVGNYEGNRDLYTMPVGGGVPLRVTYHPSGETLCDWTPDGKLLYFSSGLAGLSRQSQLLTVSATGGLPEKLPPPYGANGAISPDGEWLAYTPHSRDHRTWKRYRGGMATDIWLFHLTRHTSKKITDWEGTDSQPMWHGKMLYYLSDAGPEHRLNIWSFNPASGARKQVTQFSDYDVKWPAVGPGDKGQGEIVLQNGPGLYLLDLETGTSRQVSVTIPGDRPTIRVRDVNAAEFIEEADISSTGKRAVFEARGDVWTVPAKNGAPRNLSRTSAAAERMPSWSPDGQWIAYFSDESGEYELYIKQSDGKEAARRLTNDGRIYRYNPKWSPDSKMVGFTDMSGAMYLHVVESGETKLVDTDPAGSRMNFDWSPDSRWIAYPKNSGTRQDALWLYMVESGEKHQVTSGRFNDSWPRFDRKGDYLFFASNRNFTTPMYGDVDTTWIYAATDVLVVVPLRDEVGDPWAPKSDEEKWGEEKKKQEQEEKEKAEKEKGEKEKGEGKDNGEDEKPAEDKKPETGESSEKSDEEKPADEKKDKAIKPVEIEIERFEARAIQVPLERGSFSGLCVNHEGKLIYARNPFRGQPGLKPSIRIFDLKDEKKEEKTVVEGTNQFSLSADGKKLLIRKEKTYAIVDAAAEQKLDKPLSMSGMTARIEPREEWRQIFTEAWRIHRDYFYDPNMHGVNWEAMREHYGAMLADCVSRRDVTYVIGEMISELNVGHAYIRGEGDVADQEPKVGVGMLGADFAVENAAYRITRIHEGGPWDLDGRGPLSQPGVKVNEGDYLLAVNGAALDIGKDPWAALHGLADTVVTLTVSTKPTLDDDARDVIVKTLSDESDLRYRAWVEQNRQYVDGKTDGKVGYIHVPNTGVDGQNELVRQFVGQVDKAALIIDERWNGGGQIPHRFIELLQRPMRNYWAVRHGRDWPWPPDANPGPKCMLINGLAGSGGDCFPYYFRQSGVGKLIGMRTWGGLVGISGNPRLVDGGYTSAPTFAFFEMDGTWGVEGHGVDPDIEVIDDPALMVNGGDPQLDRAIELMLDEIAKNPYTPPKRPVYSDRSGMGIREQDK